MREELSALSTFGEWLVVLFRGGNFSVSFGNLWPMLAFQISCVILIHCLPPVKLQEDLRLTGGISAISANQG